LALLAGRVWGLVVLAHLVLAAARAAAVPSARLGGPVWALRSAWLAQQV